MGIDGGLMTNALFAFAFLFVIVVFAREFVNYRREKLAFEREDQLETWECEYCGCRIESTSIEGMVEGLRIHQVSMSCEEDEL
jgi:hypothetical protein